MSDFIGGLIVLLGLIGFAYFALVRAEIGNWED